MLSKHGFHMNKYAINFQMLVKTSCRRNRNEVDKSFEKRPYFYYFPREMTRCRSNYCSCRTYDWCQNWNCWIFDSLFWFLRFSIEQFLRKGILSWSLSNHKRFCDEMTKDIIEWYAWVWDNAELFVVSSVLFGSCLMIICDCVVKHHYLSIFNCTSKRSYLIELVSWCSCSYHGQ